MADSLNNNDGNAQNGFNIEERLISEYVIEVDEPEEMPQTKQRSMFFLPSIERLRIILMFFMCVNLLGFPTRFGNYAKAFCGFAPIAFFMISGFLVLWDTEDRSARILRTIKRTAIAFVIMAVVYFGINWLYSIIGGAEVYVLPDFRTKKFWIDFLLLNEWQYSIGWAIWYVQALLYAYLIIFALEKLKLLRFDWLIAVVLIAFTVVTGEFSKIFNFNILGHTYISGNFLTRALPYVLLGEFIHKKIDYLVIIRRRLFWFGAVFGFALMAMEILALRMFGINGYYGHLIGMPVTAFSVCMLAFQDTFPQPGFESIIGMSRRHINLIYYFSQFIGFLLLLLLMSFGNVTLSRFEGFVSIGTFFICFEIAWLISWIDRTIAISKEKKKIKKKTNS